MSKADAGFDLISTVALVGIAVTILVRPKLVSHVAHSPLVPRTGELTRAAARRLIAPTAPPRTRAREIACIIGRYWPVARLWQHALARSAGRRLNDSAGMLAFSVLADSAVQHYRGSFQNRAMYTPLATAALTLGASLFGSADKRAKGHVVRDAVYAAAAASGFAGLAFHSYNILKRPGRLSWLNLFYAAPIGAPMALALAGLLGRGAERVRETRIGRPATLLGMPARRTLAAVTAAGLAGTVGEAGLLHFRGAYHDPFMLAPVTVPPVASALLGAAALHPTPTTNRLARWWLRFTALLGFAGVGFHAYGVSRNMGGWRNWSQNVLNGPPLPAPPSFTGLALAGLAALSLMEEEESDG